jgi:hypothetical protein
MCPRELITFDWWCRSGENECPHASSISPGHWGTNDSPYPSPSSIWPWRLKRGIESQAEMGRIKDRSGPERFTERIRAENCQGCSAPLRSGAATCNPQDHEVLLRSVNSSAKNQTLTCQNPRHEPINWLFLLYMKLFLHKIEQYFYFYLLWTNSIIEEDFSSVNLVYKCCICTSF